MSQGSYLTLWEPAYEYVVPRFQPKTSSFRLYYQCHSSSADCSRAVVFNLFCSIAPYRNFAWKSPPLM